MRTGASELHQVGGEGEERAELISPLMASQPPSASTRPGRARGSPAAPAGTGPGAARCAPASGRGPPAASARRAELAVLLAEALHHPHAADRLVDDAGDLAGALLRVPLRREHRPAAAAATRTAAPARSPARTSVSSGDRNEHHDQRQHEQHDVADGERQEARAAPGSGARSELARDTSWPVGSSSWRAKSSRCSALEDRVAQVVLHVEANRPPTKRRMYESTKFTAPRPTSSASNGQSARLVGRRSRCRRRPLDERDRRR